MFKRDECAFGAVGAVRFKDVLHVGTRCMRSV